MTEKTDAAATHATKKIAESAGVMRESAVQQVDSADRRTELAADRTVLAAERTYAAWVRTGLASLASAVGAKALLHGIIPTWLVIITGSVLALFSAFCFVAAVWREVRPKILNPTPHAKRLPAPLLVAINGFLVLISLAALIGIWIGRA